MKKSLLAIITIAFCLNLSGHSSCFIDKSNLIYENNVLKKILIDGGPKHIYILIQMTVSKNGILSKMAYNHGLILNIQEMRT